MTDEWKTSVKEIHDIQGCLQVGYECTCVCVWFNTILAGFQKEKNAEKIVGL